MFCESKGDMGDLQVDDRGAEYIRIHENDRHVIRYRAVKAYVEDGQLSLI